MVFDLKGGRFHTDGCTFHIPKDQTRTIRYRFLLHTYEARELRMVRRFVQPGDAVVELGGCLGIVSCVTNRRLREPRRHLVVEANPEGVAALQRNRDLNHASFLIEHCAVKAETGARFNVNTIDITSGGMQERTGTTIEVPIKSLERLHREHGPFDVLICDIEGSELEVFENSAELFKSYRLIIVEWHEWLIGDDGVERCRDIMKRAGLKQVASERGVEAWQRRGSSRTP